MSTTETSSAISMLAWLWRRSCSVGFGPRAAAALTARLSASRATLRSRPVPLRLRRRERVGEQGAALVDEREQAAHQLRRDVDHPPGLLGLEQCAGAVAAELVLDADHRSAAFEVADGEPERLADPQPAGQH